MPQFVTAVNPRGEQGAGREWHRLGSQSNNENIVVLISLPSSLLPVLTG